MLHSRQFNCPLCSVHLINIYVTMFSLKSHGGAKSCLQEMDVAPGMPHRQIIQPKNHRRWEPSRSSACVFGGCCRHTRQDGETHSRKNRGSGRKAKGKQQKAWVRGYFEAEKSICKDRREKNTIAAARQESDSQDDGLETWETHGKGTGRGKRQTEAGQAGEMGQGQAGNAWR